MLKYSFKIQTGGTLQVPIDLSFSPEMVKYDEIQDKLEYYKDNVINPIIDIEKSKLSPYYTNNDITKKIDSIRIKPYFYQNSSWDSNPTTLSDIGFVEDDVKNKRNSLTNTFIRLSFFDSTNPKTQNLLFYSLVYLDVHTIYNNYISSGFNLLDAQTVIENPDVSTKIQSFEGYNMYLFKQDLVNNTYPHIYMKVEFNNAKNGKTILFSSQKQIETLASLHQNCYFSLSYNYLDGVGYVYQFDDSNVIASPSSNKAINNELQLKIYQAVVS